MDKQKEVPLYVTHLHQLLSAVYSIIRTNLNLAYQRNKMQHDRNSVSTHYFVGDLVWLYNPAVKSGS